MNALLRLGPNRRPGDGPQLRPLQPVRALPETSGGELVRLQQSPEAHTAGNVETHSADLSRTSPRFAREAALVESSPWGIRHALRPRPQSGTIRNTFKRGYPTLNCTSDEQENLSLEHTIDE